jgi:hypothetical protein
LYTASFAYSAAAFTGSDALPLGAKQNVARSPGQVVDLIRGAKFDTGTYFDKLKSCPSMMKSSRATSASSADKTIAAGGIHRRIAPKIAAEPLNDEGPGKASRRTHVAWIGRRRGAARVPRSH